MRKTLADLLCYVKKSPLESLAMAIVAAGFIVGHTPRQSSPMQESCPPSANIEHLYDAYNSLRERQSYDALSLQLADYKIQKSREFLGLGCQNEVAHDIAVSFAMDAVNYLAVAQHAP